MVLRTPGHRRGPPHLKSLYLPPLLARGPARSMLPLWCRLALLLAALAAPCAPGPAALATARAAHPPTHQAGAAWAWGWNISGQLGTGTEDDSIVPVPVRGLPAMVGLAEGALHSLALQADGTVWSWGGDDFGQLGQAAAGDSAVPMPVRGLPSIVAVAAATFASYALDRHGAVWAWGANDSGELGNGRSCTASTPTACTSAVPARVRRLAGVVAIAGGASRAVALTREGTVWTWGLSLTGQLGTGAVCATGRLASCQSAVPVQVRGLRRVVAIAAGAMHTLALTADGAVWAWGENGDGEVGRAPLATRDCPGTPCSARPMRVPGLGRIVAIAAGDHHSLALDAQGRVWAWGSNGFGQLGTGTTDNSAVPLQAAISHVVAIAGGRRSTVALTREGTVWTWGWAVASALAHSTYEGSTTPERVRGLSHVIALAQGSYASHTLVLVASLFRVP